MHVTTRDSLFDVTQPTNKSNDWFNNPRWNNGPLFVELFWLLSILPLMPVFFYLIASPPIFVALLFLVLLYRIGLIRIYGYFRPNWEETDPRGSVIVEALDDLTQPLEDLTQPLEDFVDEAREDVKEKLKEFDEDMSEHEWYRKNRIAIFIAAAFALIFALFVTQVIIEVL